MAEKVTTMVLRVDLQCSCCYKKIKKILYNFPQIRDQVFDEKENTVTVTVVCCSPEKIRDKLCFKGRKVIQSIEIKEPVKERVIGKPGVVADANRKDPAKPKVVAVEKAMDPAKPKVVVTVEPEKPKPDGGKPQDKPKAKGPDPAAKPPPVEPVKLPAAANPVSGIPLVLPAMACYGPSYDGFGGGAPWYNGYGIPPPPQPQPLYDGYEYGYPYGNFGRGNTYFSEENPSACSIV